MRSVIAALSSFVFCFASSSVAVAHLIEVDYQDLSSCDPLSVPAFVDELGVAPAFPTDETIAVELVGLGDPVHQTTNTDGDDVILRITNMTSPPRSFTDVWYVGNEETSFTNIDGRVRELFNGSSVTPYGNAFRIDSLVSDPTGTHHPLIAESIAADGVFQPGESWDFVIQDYAHRLPATAINSIGAPSPDGPDGISSGSIIAIPEPMSVSMLALGAAVLIGRRRR